MNERYSAPEVVMMTRLTISRSITAGFTLPLQLQVMGWLATAAMAVTVLATIASWLE
jgi:hypothetical protein